MVARLRLVPMRWWMGAGILLALLGLLGLVLLFGETRSERTGRDGARETGRAETTDGWRAAPEVVAGGSVEIELKAQ